jgi:peptidoglycan/xylan/chitin deacetylase (PgdA/CDA1 family)
MIPVVVHGLDCLLAPVSELAARRVAVPRRLALPGVALTFDDGPHPEGTPAVLEVLARSRCPAIFFLVGEQVRSHPRLAARIVDAGHLVGLHADRHRFQPRLRARTVEEDIRRGRATVEEAIGRPVVWHRPPYGAYSPAGLRAVRAAGLRPLLWSRWGRDWRGHTTPGRIAARATRGVGPGDVILLHDADSYSAEGSHWRTVEALPRILAELKRRGLDTVLPV